MSARGAAMRRVIEAAASPYPVSFDGSTIRFQLALFSLMSMSIVFGMVAVWMVRENWNGRYDSRPNEPLFVIRSIFFLCAFTGCLRATPEVAFMLCYREGSAELLTSIQAVKRWIDFGAAAFAFSWTALLWRHYPSICMNMIRLAQIDGPPVGTIRVRRATTIRLLLTLVLTFAISALVAIGKK